MPCSLPVTSTEGRRRPESRCATAALNGLDGIDVHELAIFSMEAEVSLRRWRGESGENKGMIFVSADTSALDVEMVRGLSIDGFCRERRIDAIDLMKIDMQGNEAAALRGAHALLAAGLIGTIFMELNWSRDTDAECPAPRAVGELEDASNRFSAPGERLVWRSSRLWTRALSDAVVVSPAVLAGSGT